MTEKVSSILRLNLRAYKTPTTKDAYERGFRRGYDIASYQDLPSIGDDVRTESDGRVTVDVSNQYDVLRSLSFEAELYNREFTPFEFTADEFNRARNSDARWEAFDAGIADGIDANISERG